ncbi:uncharacterized protein N7482_002388 [Penicillium canariense]|uniref:COMPASS complex subunit Sdc1 n=1 Tax=Penicillium canariense TaxID=189055 RepID=A0A9W9LTZ1_9EURO|nr:uncharacterized protein N7482_002388 [Penicillium canariense]KAJ5176511.1 hypothetical protein N7482_002388 [Penicillium canariense]
MADAPQPPSAPSADPPLPAPVPSAPAAPPPSDSAAPLPKQSTGTTMSDINGSSNTPTADLSSASATQVRPGGAPARVYLNDKIVPHLLEGMKSIARDQPANPLRALGEFLIQKSNEVEVDAKRESE